MRPLVRLIVIGIIDNLALIGEGWVAHPNPDKLLALDHGVTAHHGFTRHGILAGNFDTRSRAVKN